MLKITDEVAIEDWELTETFLRASGPGGQNVNKVATAVELRFEAHRSPNIDAPTKARLKRLAGRRWSDSGTLIIKCDTTRSQVRNREIARERLVELVRKALVTPKKRIATRPTMAAKRRRMDAKTRRSNIKSLRGSVRDTD